MLIQLTLYFDENTSPSTFSKCLKNKILAKFHILEIFPSCEKYKNKKVLETDSDAYELCMELGSSSERFGTHLELREFHMDHIKDEVFIRDFCDRKFEYYHPMGTKEYLGLINECYSSERSRKKRIMKKE